jgi:hypothetical protein
LLNSEANKHEESISNSTSKEGALLNSLAAVNNPANAP